MYFAVKGHLCEGLVVVKKMNKKLYKNKTQWTF